ncbi:MAG: FeoA family protein [Acetivibrio ethanolgignens]
MKTLREVACGQTVKVKKLTGDGPVKRRIMDMGITKGVDVFVRKLSLRKADAQMIEIE